MRLSARLGNRVTGSRRCRTLDHLLQTSAAPRRPWRTTALRDLFQRNENQSTGAGCSLNHPGNCPRVGSSSGCGLQTKNRNVVSNNCMAHSLVRKYDCVPVHLAFPIKKNTFHADPFRSYLWRVTGDAGSACSKTRLGWQIGGRAPNRSRTFDQDG